MVVHRLLLSFLFFVKEFRPLKKKKIDFKMENKIKNNSILNYYYYIYIIYIYINLRKDFDLLLKKLYKKIDILESIDLSCNNNKKENKINK